MLAVKSRESKNLLRPRRSARFLSAFREELTGRPEDLRHEVS